MNRPSGSAPPSSVSLAYRDIEEITPHIIEMHPMLQIWTYRETLYRILYMLFNDHNSFKPIHLNLHRNLQPLRYFKNLETLILDGNQITCHTKFPKLPNLYYLWVNKNDIDNLALFIDKLVIACPELRHLSMLGNDACPNYLNGGTPKQYRDYRLYVINRLKKLSIVDSSPVTEEERTASRALYGVLPQNTTETVRTRDEIDNEKLKRIQENESQRNQKLEQLALAEKEARRKKRRQKSNFTVDSVNVMRKTSSSTSINVHSSKNKASTLPPNNYTEYTDVASEYTESDIIDEDDQPFEEVSSVPPTLYPKPSHPPPPPPVASMHEMLMTQILKRGSVSNIHDD